MGNRKLGLITVSRKLIDDNPIGVSDIFGMLKFVPVRAECLYAEQAIAYVGISERFDEVIIGMKVPTYKINYSCEADGTVNSVEVELDEK